LHSPLRLVEYYFAVLGAPFTFELAYFSASVGVLIGIIAVFTLYQAHKAHLTRANGVWISIIFFVALSAILTTLGRSGLGASQALSSRYTPITILGVVALYSIAVHTSKHYGGRGRGFCVHALLTLILLGLIVSTGAGWHIGQQTRIERQMAIHVLETSQRQPDSEIAKYLNPNSTLVREWAGYLRVNRLNIFADGNVTANLPSPAQIIVYRLIRILVEVGCIFYSLPSFAFHPLNIYLRPPYSTTFMWAY
jgi:hypothetical protein